MNGALASDLEDFQKENGLSATGMLDPVTRMMLLGGAVRDPVL